MMTYKGFNEDMTCRGFQYEEGKEYETDEAEVCKSGFHACEYPLDCFHYYPPNTSVYRVVEQDGKLSGNNVDSKVASTKIKIGVRLSVADMVKVAIEFIMSKIRPEAKNDRDYGISSATRDYGVSLATGYYGVSLATGYYGTSLSTKDYGVSSATGYKGTSLATGFRGTSSETGFCGVSSAIGNSGISSATGDYGFSLATGYKGISSATGSYGTSSVTGNCGVSSTTGYKCSSEANDPCAIAVAWGYKGRARGVKGSRIVLADWEGDDFSCCAESKWELKGAKMVKIDGKKYKENTWYTMKEGKIVKCTEEKAKEE